MFEPAQPQPAGADAPLTEAETQQLAALLQAFDQGDVQVPDDIKELLHNVKRSKGIADDHDVEEVLPEPGFVVKTTDAAGRKIFINMCSSPAVPAPGNWPSAAAVPQEVSDALERINADPSTGDTEALRFPLSCGDLKPETDKRGEACAAVDCILHPDVLAGTASHRPLKAFLIELAIDWVAQKHKLELDPKFKLPKMAYKGEQVSSQRIKKARKALVTEVDDAPDQQQPPVSASSASGRAASGVGASSSGGSSSISKAPAAAAARPGSGGKAPARGVAAPGSDQQRLKPGQPCVVYEGRPAEVAVVTVQLPTSTAAAAAGADVSVEVHGQEVVVRPAGGQEVRVRLAFAVDAVTGSAQLEGQQLQLRLPYLPVEGYVEQLRRAAPHAYGSLPISHADLMQLD